MLELVALSCKSPSLVLHRDMVNVCLVIPSLPRGSPKNPVILEMVAIQRNAGIRKMLSPCGMDTTDETVWLSEVACMSINILKHWTPCSVDC